MLQLALDPRVGPTEVIIGTAGKVTALAISQDGGLLGSVGADDAVRLWELAAPDLDHTRSLGPLLMSLPSVSKVAFAGQGGTVATGRYDGSVGLWQEDPPWRQVWTSTEGGDLRMDVTLLSVSADGRGIASAWSDGSLGYRSLADPQFSFVLRRDTSPVRILVTAVGLSADGLRLVAGTSKGTVRSVGPCGWSTTETHGFLGPWRGVAAAATGQSPGTFAVEKDTRPACRCVDVARDLAQRTVHPPSACLRQGR